MRRLLSSSLLLVALAGPGFADTVVTVAGGGIGDGGPAASAEIGSIGDILLDAAGNVYLTDLLHSSIRRVDAATRTIGTVFVGDEKNCPVDLAWGAPGKLLFATPRRVEELDLATGRRRTLAGNGEWLWKEAGVELARPADQVPLGRVRGLAVDAQGGVCFGDSDRGMVLRVDPVSARLEIVYRPEPAIAAARDDLPLPLRDLAFDASGVLHISNPRHNRVYRVVAGRAIPVAGNGEWRQAYPPLPGGGVGLPPVPATATPLGEAFRLAFRNGDEPAIGQNYAILQIVDRSRNLSYLLGPYFDAGPVTGIDFDRDGALYVSRSGVPSTSQVLRVRRGDAQAEVLAGSGLVHCCGDGAPGPASRLSEPEGIAVTPDGEVIVADRANERIRRVSTRTGRISTIAGGGVFALAGSRHINFRKVREPAPAGRIHALLFEVLDPRFVAVDATGNVYFAPRDGPVYRIAATDGALTALAADRRNALGAKFPDGFAGIGGIAVDGAGTVYVAAESRIFRVSSDGKVGLLAGTGHEGFAGDGGYATLADVSRPAWPVLDGQGALYFVDAGNYRIRKIDRNGRISTVAGNGLSYPSGPGVALREAIGTASGLALDAKGDLAWASGDGRIWRLRVASGQVEKVAGGENAGRRPSPDGFLTVDFRLGRPRSLAFDARGTLFYSEGESDTVRAIRR
ncbi:MAG: hypothetical protein U0529_08945 [Thermoanaerobaculia bacterium]|mgnify:CR=1 FL=1